MSITASTINTDEASEGPENATRLPGEEVGVELCVWLLQAGMERHEE